MKNAGHLCLIEKGEVDVELLVKHDYGITSKHEWLGYQARLLLSNTA